MWILHSTFPHFHISLTPAFSPLSVMDRSGEILYNAGMTQTAVETRPPVSRPRRLVRWGVALLAAILGTLLWRWYWKPVPPPLEVSLWYWHQPFQLTPPEITQLKA